VQHARRAAVVRCAHAANRGCPAATGPDYSKQDLTNRNFASLPPGSLKGANFAKPEGCSAMGLDG